LCSDNACLPSLLRLAVVELCVYVVVLLMHFDVFCAGSVLFCCINYRLAHAQLKASAAMA
jgi:hypothetical protein